VVQGLVDSGGGTTSVAAFDLIPSDEAPVSMATIDSGAIVAVSVLDSQSVTPSQEGVDIRIAGNAPAKALTGVESANKGFVTKYAMQLFFTVPPQGTSSQ